jgi:hypothetical protein
MASFIPSIFSSSNIEDIVKQKIKDDNEDARTIINEIKDKDDKELCDISNKILDTSDLFTRDEYNALEKKQQKQIYRIGHILKVKCIQLPEGKKCDLDEMMTAMDRFYSGMKTKNVEDAEADGGARKKKHKYRPKCKKTPKPSNDLDIFEEIGELTKETKDTLKEDDSCDKYEDFMVNIKSKINSIQSWCLQKLATSLFGQEIEKEAITFVTALATGAVVVNKPTEILHMLWKIVSLTSWGLPYVIKLYMTYFVGALVKQNFESIDFDAIKTEVVKNIKSIIILTNNNPIQLLKDNIPSAVSEAIDTVITKYENDTKYAQMQDLKKAIEKGIQESKNERSMRIANVAFQTQKQDCYKNDDQLTEAIIANPVEVEPTEKLLTDMLNTEDLEPDVKDEIQEKLNKKRKRREPPAEGEGQPEGEEPPAEGEGQPEGEEPPAEGEGQPEEEEQPDNKRPKIVYGGKRKSRKQKKQSKKQKKQSKNKSKKQKKNRTRKARKVPIILDKGIEKKGKSSYKSCDTVPPGECATGCKPSWTDRAKISSRNWCHCNIDKTKCKKSLCPVHKK